MGEQEPLDPEIREMRISHWELTLSDTLHAAHVARTQLLGLYAMRYCERAVMLPQDEQVINEDPE